MSRKSENKRHWLKTVISIVAVLIFLPVVLLLVIMIALTIPSVQQKAATLAARIISEKTGIEASVGHFSVVPPFDILLENVYAGNDDGDTLAFVGGLNVRLRLDALPDSVAVKRLKINDLVAHTGDLIPAVKIDGRIGGLSAWTGSFGLDKMTFPIKDAVLENADVTLEVGNDDSPADSSSTALAIDLLDATLKNVRFHLEPTGLKLDIGNAEASVLIDLGASCYTVRSLDISDTDFGIGDFEIPIGRFYGDAIVDLGNSFISSGFLSASVPELQAEAKLHNTGFDLAEMRVNTAGNGRFQGAEFSLDADYDIDDEIFKADLDLEKTDLAKILRMEGSELVVAGHIQAEGTGINPADKKMAADVLVDLDSCRFNGIDVSGVRLSANLNAGKINGALSSPIHYADNSATASLMLDSHFSASNFLGKHPGIDLEAKMKDIDACIPTDSLAISDMNITFNTGESFSKAAIKIPGITLAADVPVNALEIPSIIPSLHGNITLESLDSLIESLPEINADLKIEQNNPLRGLLNKRGFDLKELSAAVQSDGTARKLKLKLKTPDLDGEYRLPAMNADLDAGLNVGSMNAVLTFDSDIKDGVMSFRGIDSGVDLYTVLSRNGNDVKADGKLKLSDPTYDGKKIGDKNVIFNIRPDSGNPKHFIFNADLDEIPVELAKQFVSLPEDIGIQGKIKARAVVSGLPEKTNIFAGVKPLDVAVAYRPYDVQLKLGEQEITMEDNHIKLNGLSIIGADSTAVALDGGLDLETMLLDVSIKSDRFEPTRLPKDGPIPVYGKLLTGLNGTVTGPVDSLLASVEVNVLPETDITYPIDERNLAQVNPTGVVEVGFTPQTGLDLGGRIDVPKGKIFFSPKLYPMMPFSVDSGSHITFNGDIDDTELAISASQGAKAMYKPVGQASRTVEFTTGVKVGGSLKDMHIGFYLDAPKDKEIKKELANLPEEDCEGLAAILLATGMYASDSNEAAQMDGYALSSIVQSKLNAATANKLGKTINLDFGMAMGNHGNDIKSTDYTINVSKSFFNDRLNVKLGGSVSDNAEVNKNSTSFLNNLSAEYKLDTSDTFKIRLFSVKDYNNVVEGELIKDGLGLLYNKTLSHKRDSLDRSLDLGVEANIVHRSNNQVGPDAAVTLTKQNIFNKNDIFTAKITGAYYWNINPKKQKDPARNDTYQLGADLALHFPFMQLGDWALKHIGQTSYRLGYMTENISGNYGIHKLYGGVDYSFQQGKYLTQYFSPFYLSIVNADKASEELTKNLSFTDLLKLFANNEFIPSVKYGFSYNNYREKNRDISTALDFQLKESGNLISGVMAACGRDFNERYKKFLGLEYNQFVKCQLELRNKFRLCDKLELATRALAGIVISFGNSVGAPLSEAYSIGGPNSIRAFAPRSLGPGDFYNDNYSSYIFHTGDMKLEVNAELRFPIVWKINGAVFVDAGNVWNQRDPKSYLTAEEIEAFLKGFNLTKMYNSHISADTFLNQVALGSGMGLRLDYESIVIRLDLGVAIHAPYDTGRSGYYNIPNFWKDGLQLNFGIGYPF